ncbi:MAG: hypothetical protein JWN76_2969 [Chitinophagaceae bacterium]|nr:hypothetical protein [Chitinophagaceae bacterium]
MVIIRKNEGDGTGKEKFTGAISPPDRDVDI